MQAYQTARRGQQIRRRLIGRGVLSVGLAAAISLVAAGCGNSSSGTTTTTTKPPAGGGTFAPTPSGIPTATESTTLHNQIPTSLRGKTLTIALDATYPPDEMIATNGTTIEGMDADFAYSLAQVLGMHVKLVNATFDGIIPGLLSGKYAIGDSSFTDTKAREKQVDFVDYFLAGEGFYKSASNSKSYNGLTGLCGVTVAVETGTTEQSDAQAQAKKCKVTILSYAEQTSANLAVSTGKAKVGFVDSQVAAYIVKTSNGQFKLTGTPIEVAPYGFAVPKDGLDTPLLGAFQALKTQGIYQKILAKWGLQSGAISAFKINGALF
jgi:polar amino acid transport system substrate-binding protein